MIYRMLNEYPKVRRFLNKIGLGKKDQDYWKMVGKAYLCTYALGGIVWWCNETSPFGWWNMKFRTKEEREMGQYYERIKFPYPGDEEALEEFIKGGGAIGTAIGPKGMFDADSDTGSVQKQYQAQRFDQEANKLWLRMRNEVIQELQDKGFDIQ